MKRRCQDSLAWLNEILSGPLMVLVIAALAAVLMGAAWGIIDWLRNFGLGVQPFPYFDRTPIQTQAFRLQQPGTFLGIIEDIILWYNAAFRGGTRFGSGLGLMVGAFVASRLAPARSTAAKLAVAIVSGLLIGTRSALMLGSSATLFVAGGLLGVAVALTAVLLSARLPALPDLPLLGLPDKTGR